MGGAMGFFEVEAVMIGPGVIPCRAIIYGVVCAGIVNPQS